MILVFIFGRSQSEKEERKQNGDIITEIRKLNQKMSTIDLEMTNLQLHEKNLELKMKEIDSTIKHILPTFKNISTCVVEVFYPKGSSEQKACRYYPKYDLRFQGYGYPYNSETYHKIFDGKSITLDECLKECIDYRENNGRMWNACGYSDGRYCNVYKDSTGFNQAKRYVLYRFTWPR